MGAGPGTDPARAGDALSVPAGRDAVDPDQQPRRDRGKAGRGGVVEEKSSCPVMAMCPRSGRATRVRVFRPADHRPAGQGVPVQVGYVEHVWLDDAHRRGDRGHPQQGVQGGVGDRAAADHVDGTEPDRAVDVVAAQVQGDLPAGYGAPPRIGGHRAPRALGDAGHGGAEPIGCRSRSGAAIAPVGQRALPAQGLAARRADGPRSVDPVPLTRTAAGRGLACHRGRRSRPGSVDGCADPPGSRSAE